MHMEKKGSESIELYKLVWEYFTFHASYRLKTFNFFLIASTVLTTVSANILARDEKKYILFVTMLGLMQIVNSFLFWKLDLRMKFMIKGSEKSLMELETKIANQYDTASFRLFSIDQHDTTAAKRKKSIYFWRNYYSYSKCFNYILFFFGAIGLSIILYSFSFYLF